MSKVKNRERPLVKIRKRKKNKNLCSFLWYTDNDKEGDVVTLKNKSGQALVEFVIVLPIFLFLLFAIIDFGKILYTENSLESKIDEVITLYKNDKKIEKIKEDLSFTKDKINLEYTKEDNYVNFTLEKGVTVITPGLNLILGNTYKASAKRVILNE